MPSSGQHAFVESASSKIAVSSKNCNAFFHIGITSLRINCAGVGGLTTKVTVSLCSSLAYCVELCQRLASHPAAFLTRWRGGWFLFRCFYQASFLIECDPIAENRVIVLLKLFGILPVFDLLQSRCAARFQSVQRFGILGLEENDLRSVRMINNDVAAPFAVFPCLLYTSDAADEL